MSQQFIGIIGAILLGVLANDVWALSAPGAHRLVVLAARLWARDHDQAQVLGEEWRAYIDERPGQLLKLCTAVAFFAAAIGRSVGRRLRLRRRPVLRAPAWIASIDFTVARANAVAVGLLVGLISSFAPLACYATGLPADWALFAWGIGLAVAIIAVMASVTVGFFIGRQPVSHHDTAETADGLRLPTTEPATVEFAATEVPLLVRPFVVHEHKPEDPADPSLVRPYVRKGGER
jgi:hypothetical protein